MAGVAAATEVEGKIWRSKMLFRTFAAAVGGTWCIAMASLAFGPSLPALLGGAAFCTFIFYVLDQTENLIKGFFKKKEKKSDGNDSGSNSSDSSGQH